MRAMVLGPNGQLGTDICRLAEENSNVDILPISRAELDVEELDEIPNVIRQYEFDVLINCTSYHRTDEAEDNASKAVAVNAHAVESMANVCNEKKAHFFHVSTDYVFPGDKSTPYTEQDCPGPVNVYGASKFYGETLAMRAYSNTYIFRVASLFGVAGSSGKGGNFVETMIRLAKENKELRVIDDIRMSPTSTRTIASTTIELLSKDFSPGVYHLVNSGDATWKEFAQKIVENCDIDVPVHATFSDEYKTRAHRPRYSVLDNSKIETIVGKLSGWQSALEDYLREKGHKST